MSKAKNTNPADGHPTRELGQSTGTETQGISGEHDRPQELTPNAMLAMQSAGQTDAAPTLAPPVNIFGQGGVTAVLTNKRITGLWGKSQDRNSWAHIDGIGWKKLVNSSASTINALTLLAGQARALNRPIDYRDEADGMIYEMYVW
jgi:hypothetical protein